MSQHTKATSLHTYQSVLYGRALHPELFTLKDRKVLKTKDYEFEAWIMNGGHMLRFEHRTMCASELVTDQDGSLPDSGVLAAALCAGERDYEHKFPRDGVLYLTTVQTETLSENLYAATFEEMLSFAVEVTGMCCVWEDGVGRCLSLIDIQRYPNELHAQAYHLQANGGVVVRTQTIFEHA
jgi:hypothetical protein